MKKTTWLWSIALLVVVAGITLTSIQSRISAGVKNSRLPPSRYMAICTNYEGIENGKFPFAEGSDSFSGQWFHAPGGKIAIVGFYDHGFPCGTWILYSSEGNARYLEQFSSKNESTLYRFSKKPPFEVEEIVHYKITYLDDKVIKEKVNE